MPLPAQSSPAHLSDEERRRIEAEERAAAQAEQARAAAEQRRLAALTYRLQVRAALRPRPWWSRLHWALPLAPLLGLTVFLTVRPSPAPAVDSAWGGITDSLLMTWCAAQLNAERGTHDLQFDSLAQAQGQFTASPDGKRWDGTAHAGRQPVDFSCSYSATDGRVHVQVLQEDTP